jgi:gas vesicle protein
MATKLTLGAHAVKALMEQAKRFDAMSVHLAKSADLATSQADEIAKWTSKLIDAVTKIRRETQDEAAACRERVQDKIRTLKTQADSAKRKILDTTKLDSSRTIKANFRLIFGPPRDTEYKSRATKAVMATNLIRINTIRGLCESNPHGVITLSTTYPTKVWTESSPVIFDGIIKQVKEEKEQDWPEEIVDIMDELEMERPMSVEFKNLRGMINFVFAFVTDQ